MQIKTPILKGSQSFEAIVAHKDNQPNTFQLTAAGGLLAQFELKQKENTLLLSSIKYFVSPQEYKQLNTAIYEFAFLTRYQKNQIGDLSLQSSYDDLKSHFRAGFRVAPADDQYQPLKAALQTRADVDYPGFFSLWQKATQQVPLTRKTQQQLKEHPFYETAYELAMRQLKKHQQKAPRAFTYRDLLKAMPLVKSKNIMIDQSLSTNEKLPKDSFSDLQMILPAEGIKNFTHLFIEKETEDEIIVDDNPTPPPSPKVPEKNPAIKPAPPPPANNIVLAQLDTLKTNQTKLENLITNSQNDIKEISQQIDELENTLLKLIKNLQDDHQFDKRLRDFETQNQRHARRNLQSSLLHSSRRTSMGLF